MVCGFVEKVEIFWVFEGDFFRWGKFGGVFDEVVVGDFFVGGVVKNVIVFGV